MPFPSNKKILFISGILLACFAAFFIYQYPKSVVSSFLALLTPDQKKSIILKEDGFHPQTLTIRQDEVATWRTATGKSFWPASNFHPAHKLYPAFDPKKPLGSGESWSFRFEKPGTWNYHDHLAPYFTGTIIVQGIDTAHNTSPPCRKEDCWYEKLLALLKKDGIDTAFGELARRYYEELEFTYRCHDIAHELGHIAYGYMRRGDMALSEKTAFCSYGFYHGFMESYAKDKGYHAAREFCLALDPLMVEKAPDAPLQCFHGIGHGAVYLDSRAWENEQRTIDSALTVCDEAADTKLQRSRCATGVFNTIANFYLGAEYGLSLSKEDPLSLCHAQKEAYQEPCYISMNIALMNLAKDNFPVAAKYLVTISNDRYAIQAMINLASAEGARRMNDTEFKDHISACRNLQTRLRIPCIQGLAYGFLEHGPPEKEYIKPFAFCGSPLLTAEERQECFDYIFSYLSFWYAPSKLEVLCSEVNEALRSFCRERTRQSLEWKRNN